MSFYSQTFLSPTLQTKSSSISAYVIDVRTELGLNTQLPVLENLSPIQTGCLVASSRPICTNAHHLGKHFGVLPDAWVGSLSADHLRYLRCIRGSFQLSVLEAECPRSASAICPTCCEDSPG